MSLPKEHNHEIDSTQVSPTYATASKVTVIVTSAAISKKSVGLHPLLQAIRENSPDMERAPLGRDL